MTARSKSDSAAAWKFLGRQQKARRGFEQYLKSINMTRRISSRWLGVGRGRLLLRCPGRDAPPTKGNMKPIRSGAWVGGGGCGAALGPRPCRDVHYSVAPPLPGFPAKSASRPGGRGLRDAPHTAITSSNSIAPGSSPRRSVDAYYNEAPPERAHAYVRGCTL